MDPCGTLTLIKWVLELSPCYITTIKIIEKKTIPTWTPYLICSNFLNHNCVINCVISIPLVNLATKFSYYIANMVTSTLYKTLRILDYQFQNHPSLISSYIFFP